MNATDATILVVDDDDALREVIVYELQRKKYNILEASNGTQALQIVKDNNIHLVVSDIRMPGGDGIELLQKIREIFPAMPVVVFVTGFSDLAPEKAIEMGAHKVFEKPFKRTEFLAEIAKIISDISETAEI